MVKLIPVKFEMRPNEQTVDEFNVDHWRTEFKRLLEGVKETRKLAKQLAEVDDYYKSANGASDVNNAKKSRAGLQATRRIVLAMQKLQDAQQQTVDRENLLLRRQKLTRI